MILYNSSSQLFRIQTFVLRSLVAILLVSYFAGATIAQQVDVWIGTSGNDGIFHFELNTENGKLTKPRNVSKIANSGFLALHPTEKVLYSSGRQGDKRGIAAFSIGKSEVDPVASSSPASPELKAVQARLQELTSSYGSDHPAVIDAKQKIDLLKRLPKKKMKAASKQNMAKGLLGLKQLSFVETGDGGATCISVDKTGKVAMSAQYGGGSVSTYQLDADGSIKQLVGALEHGSGSGVHKKKRQDQSHPHWVGTSPDNKFLMVPDLGKDAVVVYKLDLETGKLEKHSEIPSPPGAGPRHMKFHGSGKYAYVLNEFTLSVSVFEYEAAGAKFKKLQEIPALTEELKDDDQLHSAAEIRIHPSGKFLYTSNRGHDSITVFAIDHESGKLTFVQREPIRGAWPRNFNIDPSGKWLLAAGQHTNTVTLFSIDSETGKLAYARKSVNVPAPICVLFGE